MSHVSGRSALITYCDDHVCLFVRSHCLSWKPQGKLHHFLHVDCSGDSWRCECDALCTSGFVDDVIFT